MIYSPLHIPMVCPIRIATSSAIGIVFRLKREYS